MSIVIAQLSAFIDGPLNYPLEGHVINSSPSSLKWHQSSSKTSSTWLNGLNAAIMSKRFYSFFFFFFVEIKKVISLTQFLAWFQQLYELLSFYALSMLFLGQIGRYILIQHSE